MPSPVKDSALVEASRGLDLLLNDDVQGSRKMLQAQGDANPYALAGLGICAFLTAAVGLEEDRLQDSMNTLANAEAAAKKKKAATTEADPGQWWTTNGLEYEVLLADVVAAQSLLHLLGDSYVEYAKSIYKLNTSFKYFSTIFKAVFPQGVKEDANVTSLIAELNERYRTAKVTHSLQAQHKPAFSRLRYLGFSSKNSSTPDISSLSINGHLNPGAASVPVSVGGSTNVSVSGSPPNGNIVNGSEIMPTWTESPTLAFIISGAAFGHGLFELVFALLPPKARKMFSWLGYGVGNRKVALKLLELTAQTGTDIHASFAGLTLVSYYCLIFIFSGWQNDREALFASCNRVLNNELEKHPNGTLWLLNKAKLLRFSGKVEEASKMLEGIIAKPSTFRQALSSVQYEYCWVLIAQLKYEQAAASFLKMLELNSWSHITCYALAAGCIHSIENRSAAQEKQLEELYEKIPTFFNKNKRFMGSPPSSEVYLEKRIKFYTAKTQRLVAEGELAEGSSWWKSVHIPVSWELCLYWNQYSYFPESSLHATVKKLQSLLEDDTRPLDTPEEVALAQTILGTCHTSLKDYKLARKQLMAAEAAFLQLGEAYTYLGALSRLYLAILECKEAEVTGEWKDKLSKAEAWLDQVFAQTGFDMNGRVESRGQMLRVEIAEKKSRLGL